MQFDPSLSPPVSLVLKIVTPEGDFDSCGIDGTFYLSFRYRRRKSRHYLLILLNMFV